MSASTTNHASGKRIACLVATSLALASNLTAQASARVSASNVAVRIETDRPVYHTGDVVKVRMTVQNMSGHPVRMFDGPHTLTSGFRVLDANAEEVKRVPYSGPPTGGGSFVNLRAGERKIFKGSGRHEWTNLRDWGYDLQAPGQYTLVGYLATFAKDARPDQRGVKSNEVTITITK
jgi:hypothetical protein